MEKELGPLGKHIISLLEDGRTREEIETTVLANEQDEEYVKEIVAEAIKLYLIKRRSQGFLLILVGAVICFSSFLLTITSSFSHGSFPWVLYGLTSLGIIVAFAGFMKVF